MEARAQQPDCTDCGALGSNGRLLKSATGLCFRSHFRFRVLALRQPVQCRDHIAGAELAVAAFHQGQDLLRARSCRDLSVEVHEGIRHGPQLPSPQ